MKLKKLELYGFKSFSDRTEIVFDQGITGIVGPNGSGKSNIGDAVRWVLGEQSPRILRGAKMEDVIFGGTQKRKRASYCEVSLVFDNSDGSLRSAFSEVSVTRRVYRSGESEYRLNKANCRLRDIQELFRDTGIGREGYSLIGQGRIDEILSQKSEDRRLVFEEAAGIMTYRVRKEEAERKLARTGENLTRVYDILDEIEKRLSTLEVQAAQAKKYQELFSRLKELEINIFLNRYERNIRRVDSLKASMEGLRDLILSHEARLNECTAQREELDREIEALEQALSEARRAHSAQLEETHQAEIERERVSSRLTQAKASFDEAGRQLSQAKEELDRLTALSGQGPGEEALRGAISEASAAYEQGREKLENDLTLEKTAEDTLDRHKADILAAMNRQSDVRDRQTRQQTIRAQMEERLREIGASMNELTAQRALLSDQLALDEQAKAAAEDALAQGREHAAEIEERLALNSRRAQSLSDETRAVSLHLQSDKSRLRLMEEMARDMAGYQQSVKKALEYAGKDARVHGVLARLISVPRELETAIDMVLGGALQNIVTDDEDTAKRLIDYLRANRLGRATFLPRTSVRARVLTPDERRLLSMPGCLGAASDLIGYDEKYRGIVENLLGRTVIAEDLEHGIPIMRAGRHAFRLVTLAGDVMHSGGSMTGGTAQNRAVSLLGREREIKDLRAGVEEMNAQLEKLRGEAAEAANETEKTQAELTAARDRLRDLEVALARETEHVAGTQNDLSGVSDRIEKTEQAMAQLRDGIEEIDRDLAAVSSTAQSVSVDREQMEQRTGQLQRELSDRRAETEKQRQLTAELQLKLTQAQHELQLFEREKEQKAAQEERLRAGIGRLTAQREAAEAEQAELSLQLSGADEKLDALRKRNEGSLSAVEDLDRTRTQKAAAQRELNRLLDETHRELDDDSQKLHRSELACAKAQNELDQLCDHLLTSYDLTYAGAEALRSKEKFDVAAGEKEAAALRGEIRELGPINVAAIEAYETESARYKELSAQRDDLLQAKEDLEKLIERLLGRMKGIFTDEFRKLGGFFSETFTRLFGGGQAELRLTDETDPLNCGIEIVAQPPGKKLQLLSLLSGGERALTAIAILFAMLKLKPTPFCILDEIEAALDDANIANFVDYLDEYAKTTQFVVITHRKGTMESCDSLYGVAMEERGVSRMVSVNLQDYPN